MTRFVLSAHLGPLDAPVIPLASNERLVAVDFLDDAGRLQHGIGRMLRDLKRLGLRPTAIGLDLLVLAILTYAADTRINRVQTSQDGWTREVRLVVPSSDPDRWNAHRDLVSQLLRFLTGDLWAVSFRSWPSHVPSLPIDEQSAAPTPFDDVCLFSGGLDSLIGAIDSIGAGSVPLFASHGADGSVSGPQQELFASLAKHSSQKGSIQRVRFGLRLENELIPGIGSENSTRGRSFLFFAIGAMAGSGFGKNFRLRVPENGFISLNVPLDATRLGSNSTRTTHPYYIHRWNELLRSIGIPCTVYNPYWNKTKGEMIRDCTNFQLLEKLAGISVSCSHPAHKRFARDDKNHCGTCLPCIIRRAAFAASPMLDPTDYRIQDLAATPLKSTMAHGAQIRAFQFALRRLEENPKLPQIWIHKPGPLQEDLDRVDDLVGVYTRGMAEVRAALQHATTIS